MRAERTFRAEPRSVPAARRFAIQALGDTTFDVRQSIELMVSELATNGVRHGRTSFDLVVERTTDEIRIEVTDRGGGRPTMRFPGPDEPTGRGLQIVEMLSDEWGVEEDPGSGKTVWFTLSAPSVAGQPADMAAASRFTSGRQGRASRELMGWTFLVSGAPALR